MNTIAITHSGLLIKIKFDGEKAFVETLWRQRILIPGTKDWPHYLTENDSKNMKIMKPAARVSDCSHYCLCLVYSWVPDMINQIKVVPNPLCSVSLKQSLSLLELEQQLSWIRAEVEAGSERRLSWYMLADDENALADQVFTWNTGQMNKEEKTYLMHSALDKNGSLDVTAGFLKCLMFEEMSNRTKENSLGWSLQYIISILVHNLWDWYDIWPPTSVVTKI